jgi:hypothetical protein
MENDLLSVYEQHYLNPQKASVISEAAESENEEEDTSTAPKATKKSSPRKKKLSGAEIGAIYGERAQRNSFDSLFKTFMEEFDSGDQSFDDNSFEFDGEDMDDGFSDENEQTFTLSELKAMTLGELADLVGGNAGNDDDMFSDDDGMDFDDEGDIPTESYGQGGAGKHYGDQGNYDGKAKKQAASSHVKGNGDADFSKQDTKYAPEDTEGSEGECLGDQGNYDGKAKKQAASSHVKGNGDANLGKSQRTGYGKKEGERLF